MPSSEYNDRTVQVYFGEENDERLSKSNLREFITGRMGIVRKDGRPGWSEGITELLECGMDHYEEQVVNSSAKAQLTVAQERIEELENHCEYLQQRLKLQSESERKSSSENALKAQCKILEVICRDEHIGADSPNFVDPVKIVDATGLDVETVAYHLRVLSRSHLELVVEDRNEERVKAQSDSLFRDHCSAVGFSPDEIRSENQ